MPWLYEHRYQLDGLRPLIEIAHWVIMSHVPPEDQDDVEQEIVIALIQALEKYGDKGKGYLLVVARNEVNGYLRKKYQRIRRLSYIQESNKGEMVIGNWRFVRDADDARLDAIATLATLPKRLVEIGYKRLDGEKLSEADQSYWRREKAKLRPKLNCRRYANRLSDWEKRRILALHSESVSMSRTARIMGRTNRAVMRVLAGNQPLSRQNWLAKMKIAAEEKDNQVKHSYFVERKTISQIARDFHLGPHTVQKVVRAEQAKRTVGERELEEAEFAAATC